MSAKWISRAVVLLLTGCGSHEVIEFHTYPQLPANWGGYFPTTAVNGDCPHVQGTYRSIPEIQILKNGEFEEKFGDIYSLYGLVPFEIANTATKKISFVPVLERKIEISQLTAGQLTLVHIWTDGAKLETSTFEMDDLDFECSNGFVEFPVSSYDGQLEGTNVNGQEIRRLTAAQDGALIFIKSVGKYKSKSAFDEAGFEHVFHRFIRSE